MLKLFVFTACFLLPSINFGEAVDKNEFKSQLMTIAKECMVEIEATEADIEDIANNIPAAGMEGKCLHACVMKKFGFMNANGKLNKSFGIEFAKKCAADDTELLSKAIEVIEHCVDIDVSGNACEAVEEYKTCMSEKAKALNISDMEF